MTSNPKHLPDEVLAGVRAGDRAAFAALVRATQDDVYTLALRLTGNPEDAHDVAQDTYIRAFRAIGSFRGDASVTTWLHRITVNTALSHRARRRRRHAESLDALGFEPTPDRAMDPARRVDPARLAEHGELRRALVDALADLPDGARQVVVLKDIYDLPHDEVARLLGISPSAARVRLFRARRRLRELLFGDAGAQP